MAPTRTAYYALAIGVLALESAGCGDIFGTKDAHQPGDVLGTFHVVATRASNTCGNGALGSQASWDFDVKLARDTAHLFWNNGEEQIGGSIDDDRTSFHFETGVLIDMRTEMDHGLPACSMSRRDRASGELSSSTDDVASFDGTLEYAFTPSPGSSCQDLVGTIFASLPCDMKYAIKGSRTVDPER